MRIFRNKELSEQVVLAATCLPSIHRPIEIDGEPYWDGAFCGNPAVYPLVYDTRWEDIVSVLLQPLSRADTPKTAEAIRHRMTELSLVTPFLREMRAIARVRYEVRRGLIPAGRIEKRIARLRIFLVQDEALMNQLAHGSQFNTHLAFLESLHQAGRQRAEEWVHGYRRDPDGLRTDLQATFG